MSPVQDKGTKGAPHHAPPEPKNPRVRRAAGSPERAADVEVERHRSRDEELDEQV